MTEFEQKVLKALDGITVLLQFIIKALVNK